MAAGNSDDLSDDAANTVGTRVRCGADGTLGGVPCNKLYHHSSLAYRVQDVCIHLVNAFLTICAISMTIKIPRQQNGF